MDAKLLELATFHLTGNRVGDVEEIGGDDLCPALFGGYRDLTKLRYDFPLVLADGADGGCLRSLTGVVNGVLQAIAPPGVEGERLRRHVLRLEREIRGLVAAGAGGSLGEVWGRAESGLLSRNDAAVALKESLESARAALKVDGELVDCDEKTPLKVIAHAWKVAQKQKARRVLDQLHRLTLKLADILRADAAKSDEARAPARLKGSVGGAYDSVFDFEAMARILRDGPAGWTLPEARRRRIEWALGVLKSQRFFAAADGNGAEGGAHGFVFDGCARALDASRKRLPEMVELVKAIAIAELEVENRYKEAKHDRLFADFDDDRLERDDLERFPSYLVCLSGGRALGAEIAKMVELLSSGLAVKILVQSDDILAEPSLRDRPFGAGVDGLRLASMALGIPDVFVMQASSSNLYALRERLLKGLAYPGPALFSVFSGAAGEADGLPVYLKAAAATHSRAFPTFVYDPSAGGDLASRFSIDANPQAERSWPVEELAYEDPDLQRGSETVAFSFVDFAAADRRHAWHLAKVPKAGWHAGMIPAAEYLELEPAAAAEKVPYVPMVDGNNVLHRVIVRDRLIEVARRCRATWRGLQELGGIRNSHALRLLAKERAAWEEDKKREIEALKREPRPAEAPPAPAPAQPAVKPAAAKAPPAVVEAPAPEAAPERPKDEPYIETPRCTTCNECTNINNKMFAYNENKQAYIADLSAGTYRQMVEAAETCQVSIIHPGKPKNPNEPDLDELIKRAEPFN